MKSLRRPEWTASQREAIEALLAKANGRRTRRVLTILDVERCAEAAVVSELGFSWTQGGDAPDAREVTSVCLCAVTGVLLTVSVGPGHGAATPASAWLDITTWDRYREAANAAACQAWAGRPRHDRVVVRLAGAPSVDASARKEDLLAAVLTEPAADAPRLVLADWLIERGQPRGEFIAIQCELARGGSASSALRVREEELLEAFRGEWGAGVSPDVAQLRFRRGFVESVEVFDASALPQLEHFFQVEPVTALVFRATSAIDLERLAALEWLERLRALEFRSASRGAFGALGRERLGHLLGSRRLRRLQRLALVGQRLGDDGVMLLAEQGGNALPGVEQLLVEEDAITDKGVGPLSASRWLGRFETLSLADNDLRVEGTEALAHSRSPGRLTHLALGGNRIGNEGAVAIARSARFRTLRELSLPRNRIGPAGAEALLDTDVLSQLEVLDLVGNPLGATGHRRVKARFAS